VLPILTTVAFGCDVTALLRHQPVQAVLTKRQPIVRQTSVRPYQNDRGFLVGADITAAAGATLQIRDDLSGRVDRRGRVEAPAVLIAHVA